MRKVLISAVAALLAGALLAQSPRTPMAAQPWWESRLAVGSLNLSDTQAKQLNAIQSSYVSRLMELRDAVNKADGNLAEIYNQPTIDELKADAAVDQYANARDNLTRALSQLSLKMRSVLTAEQWQQLVNRQNARLRMGPGRGRRGPSSGRRTERLTTSSPSAPLNKAGPTISQK